MAVARDSGTAVLLQNGRVLVAGGRDSNSSPLASAELYDPATETWTATGSLVTGRWSHTATLLADGKVLVAGGVQRPRERGLYDPATGTWTATGSLDKARTAHTATFLADGKVLVVGGFGNSGVLASAELYDPVTGTWTRTAPLVHGRANHVATLLPDGKVLVAGGNNAAGTIYFAEAEIYDPASGTWSETGRLAVEGRDGPRLTLLLNGLVLVAGGQSLWHSRRARNYMIRQAEHGALPARSRIRTIWGHTATLLPNGAVMVTGGISTYIVANVEIYNPNKGTWSSTGEPHHSTPLSHRYLAAQRPGARRRRRGHVWQHSRQRGTRRSCRAVRIPRDLWARLRRQSLIA